MEQKFPNRKPLRLKNYDYGAAGYYFVTLCTKGRKKILSDIVPSAHTVPKIQLTPIGKIVDKYINSSNKIQGVVIDKYVIMPDHIHMIIKIVNWSTWEDYLTARGRCHEATEQDGFVKSAPTKTVWSVVRSLKILTTKEIGKPIFQRSYNDHIIRGEQDYIEIWRYIENNPLKYKLNKNNSL